jgi:DNA repair exonuclease SbcCD ATPase subunit
MSKKDRRAILEGLASRIDPADHAQHLEEQIKQLKNQASRVMVAVQQIDEDPHAQETEKSQVDDGYRQLESLLWRIKDLEERLEGMTQAHVTSIAGLNRAQRRAAAKKGSKGKVADDLSGDDDDAANNGDDPPATS